MLTPKNLEKLLKEIKGQLTEEEDFHFFRTPLKDYIQSYDYPFNDVSYMKFIVILQTPNAKDSLGCMNYSELAEKHKSIWEIPYHFIIDEEGIHKARPLFFGVDTDEYTNPGGLVFSENTIYIGLAMNYLVAPEKQELPRESYKIFFEALISLVYELAVKYKIPAENILTYREIYFLARARVLPEYYYLPKDIWINDANAMKKKWRFDPGGRINTYSLIKALTAMNLVWDWDWPTIIFRMALWDTFMRAKVFKNKEKIYQVAKEIYRRKISNLAKRLGHKVVFRKTPVNIVLPVKD